MRDRREVEFAFFFLQLGLAGLVITLVAALCLRGREALFKRRPAAGIVLGALAMLTGSVVYVGVFTLLLPQIPRTPIAAGAFVGLALGGIALAMMLPIVLLMFVIDPAFRLKIPDPGMAVWQSAAALVGCLTGGILIVQMWLLMRRSGAFALLLVPLAVALFPLVRQVFWAPTLLAALRRRQQHLEPPCASDLRGWSDDLAATYRLGKVEVLFGPAKLANAAAVGFWPLTRFIMIGDGLTAVMPPNELRAILTHEIAHVLRSDVRNQLLLWIGMGTAWIYVWTIVSMSLGLHGPMWAMVSGAGWMALIVLAGRYSRHCELAADRLAAELMEAPADMRAALIRLGEVTKVPPDRRSHTHPSLNERLASLGSP